MPQFSVLLPTHNRADVLPLAIRSVLAQTRPDFELLIVGDGCTDGTAAVVQGIADPRIRWYDLPKAPHFGYANRNVVLREAKGRCIAYMQHDDLWLPDHLGLLSACLEDNDVEWAYSRCIFAGPEGALSPSVYNLNNPATLQNFLRHPWSIPSTNVMHRRECLEKYGHLDESLAFAADWELWTRIINGGVGGCFAYQPIPASLHFRAHWRTEDQPWMPTVWKAQHATSRLLPAMQTVPVPAGVTAQEAVWAALSADPRRWTQDLRKNVFRMLDDNAAANESLLLRTLYRLLSLKGKLLPPGSFRDRLYVRLMGRF